MPKNNLNCEDDNNCCRIVCLAFGLILTAIVLIAIIIGCVKLCLMVKRLNCMVNGVDVDKCRECFERTRKMMKYYK